MIYIMTIFVRFFGKGANFVSFFLLLNNLDIKVVGEYGLIFTTLFIFSIAMDMGLRNSIGTSQNNRIPINKSFTKLRNHTIACIPGFIIIGLVTSYSINLNQNYLLGIICSILLLHITYTRTAQGIILSNNNVQLINKLDFTQKTTFLILIIVLIKTDELTLYTTLSSLIISFTTNLVFCILRYGPDSKNDLIFFSKDIYKNGLLFMLTAFTMILLTKYNILYSSIKFDSSYSGIYFSVIRISEITTEIAVAISMVLFSRATSTKIDINDIAKTCRITFTTLFVLSMIILIIFYMYLDKIPSLKNFELRHFTLAIIAALFGSLPMTLFSMLPTLIKRNSIFITYLTVFIIQAFLSFIFPNLIGFDGLFISLLISNIILFFCIITLISNKTEIKFLNFLIIKYTDISKIFQGKMQI